MTKLYRTDRWAWFFITGISCLPLISALAMLRGSHHASAGNVLFLGGALILVGFAVAWLSAFRIEVAADTITFNSLFQGRQSIRREEIGRVKLYSVAHSGKPPASNHARRRLVIEPRPGSSAKRMDISAKLFSETTINEVLALSPDASVG